MFPNTFIVRTAASLLASLAIAGLAGAQMGSAGSLGTLPNGSGGGIEPVSAASGAWFQYPDTTGEIFGELRDANGIVMYGLHATTQALSAYHGSINGELLERNDWLVKPQYVRLVVLGQYVKTDAQSGVFRALVLLDFGGVVPLSPAGAIRGTFGRLKVIDPQSPESAAIGAGGARVRNVVGGCVHETNMHAQRIAERGSISPGGSPGIVGGCVHSTNMHAQELAERGSISPGGNPGIVGGCTHDDGTSKLARAGTDPLDRRNRVIDSQTRPTLKGAFIATWTFGQ